MMMAMETMARYMDRRSQERKVRSLAQWSRASEVVFSKRRAPERGEVVKMCLGLVLGSGSWVCLVLSVYDIVEC